jgi:Zn-dependent metalloprotease
MKKIPITLMFILLFTMFLAVSLYGADKSNPSMGATSIHSTKLNGNRCLVNNNGIPTELEGNLSAGLHSINPVDMAFEYFQNNKYTFKIKDAQKEFCLGEYSKDDLVGDSHVKLLQTINGVRVRYGQYILRFDQKGQLTRVYGQIDPEAKKVDTNPTISEEHAKQMAISANKSDTHAKDYTKSNGLLVINTKNSYHLVWDIECGLMIYRIDAKTGSIIESGSSAIK